MNLKTFLATVRLYWKTFAVVTIVVFGAGLALLLLSPAQYVSTTQLMVSIQGSTTAAAYQNDTVVTGRVNSYIALLTSDVSSQRVIDKLGLPLTAPELAAKISATNVPPTTSIIDVAVTDQSPEQARRIADTLATEFISFTDALETPTGEDGQKVHTTVVTTASEPQSRLVERVLLGVLVALAALLLGAVAVWIRSLTDSVVRTADRAAAAAGVPVLGSVSSTAAASIGELDGYRRLRTRLQSTSGANGGGVVEIASVDGDVDVAGVASNLGRAMELAGGRSVVVNAADPESSEPSAPDLAQGIDGFPDTLFAKGWAAEPDTVATKATSDLVGRLRSDYKHVIIATPPVLLSPTASVVSEYAGAVLLLVSARTTKRRNVRRAAASLLATGAPLTGVVLVAKGSGKTAPAKPNRQPERDSRKRASQRAKLPAGSS
jgi:capsular polysaccharide biosynthesis protein